MKTLNRSYSSSGELSSRPGLKQTENNATLWIGRLQSDLTDHFGGQTFTCPDDGFVDNIQLYASIVPYPGEVYLTLHEFDTATKKWGQEIGKSALSVKHNDRGKWICFNLPAVKLDKSTTYGFRIHSSNAMIGLGEAVHDTDHPFSFGHEWHASSVNQGGDYFSYFSLAFKVEMRA